MYSIRIHWITEEQVEKINSMYKWVGIKDMAYVKIIKRTSLTKKVFR